MNTLNDIRNVLIFSENLGTGGQPTGPQLAAIASAGYELVINLALPTSTGAVTDEEAVVRGLGMDYYAIPVIWEQPTQDNLLRFFEVMEINQGRRIFLHCAANMRVSAFLFLYRVLVKGIAETEAEKDLYRIWRPEGWWLIFIEDSLEP